MSGYTKLSSIEVSIDLWSLLSSGKASNKLSAYQQLDRMTDQLFCPLCMYNEALRDDTDHPMSCKNCPALPEWFGDKPIDEFMQVPCETMADTPWNEWRRAVMSNNCNRDSVTVEKMNAATNMVRLLKVARDRVIGEQHG